VERLLQPGQLLGQPILRLHGLLASRAVERLVFIQLSLRAIAGARSDLPGYSNEC